MNQTVLITGTSSGYGKATAELFLDRGWNVVATMRQPKPDIFGSQSDHLKVLPLDVTDSGSVSKGIAEAISTFGTDRRARQQRGDRCRRRLRGHPDGHRA